jgi:translation elongation factor P/translation initiation factor 5A
MKSYFILFLILTSLNSFSQTDNECKAQYLDITKEGRTLNDYPYFKRLSYYTQGGRQDPSSDTLYFMVLNYYLDVKLTWNQYYKLQIKMRDTQGENSYSAPTLQALIPLMWKYLKSLNKITEINETAKKKADEQFKHLSNNVLAEVLGSNRVIYRVLDSDKQSIVHYEGDGQYLVRDQCNKLYLMNMRDYTKYTSIEDELKDLQDNLRTTDTREVLSFIEKSLYSKSFLKTKLAKFLDNYPNL